MDVLFGPNYVFDRIIKIIEAIPDAIYSNSLTSKLRQKINNKTHPA